MLTIFKIFTLQFGPLLYVYSVSRRMIFPFDLKKIRFTYKYREFIACPFSSLPQRGKLKAKDGNWRDEGLMPLPKALMDHVIRDAI